MGSPLDISVPIVIGPAAFTSSTTVFGLLAALSDSYRIAPVFGVLRHGVLRKILLFALVLNAALALFHPLAAAGLLLLILLFLAWRIVPAQAMRRDAEAVEQAIEEEVVEEETELADEAITEEAQREKV